MKRCIQKIIAVAFSLMLAVGAVFPASAEAVPLDLGEMIADADGWYGETMIYDDFVMGPNYMELGKGHTKIACYGDYSEFDLTFKAKAQYDEDKGDFCFGVNFRDKDGTIAMWDPSKTACYSLVFFNVDISLDRVVNGEKTNLTVVSGYPNDNMEEHTYLLSVRDVSGGVNIRVVRDGKTIIDVTDKIRPITGSGPITVMQHEKRDVILYGNEPPRYISQTADPVDLPSPVQPVIPIQPATIDVAEAARIPAPETKVFYVGGFDSALWIAVGCGGAVLVYAVVMTWLYLKSRKRNRKDGK